MVLTYDDVYKVIDDAGTQIDMDKLTPTAILSEIGADSLDMMTVLLGVQELTNIEVEDSEIQYLSTVTEICEYMNKKS